MTGTSARRTPAAFFTPFPTTVAVAIAMNAVLLVPGVPAQVHDTVWRAAMVLAAILGALVAHDLAHLAAARMLGLRTVVATLGLFVIAPTRRGLRMRAVRTWGEIGAGLIVEPRADRRMNGRLALVALAGPAASLALGVVALDGYPALAVACLVRFLLAALPIGAQCIPTDGARSLLLLAGGAPADRFFAMQRITAAQYDGVRPRAWPERWITDATTLRDGSAAEAMACAAAFRRALDGCAHDRASAFLDRALALRATLPRAPACILLADAAYFEARIHDDATRARAWLD